MSLIISTNHEYQKSNVPTGFMPEVISNEEEAKAIVANFDWTPAIFRDGHRKVENFMESVCIAVDIDNTTASRMSIEEFKREFEGFEYWIFTSRNHRKEKKSGTSTYQAADRFHALFPLSSTIKTPHEYREFIEAMIERYPCIDKGAKDGARFFFGNKETEIVHNLGKSLEKPAVEKINGNTNGKYDPALYENVGFGSNGFGVNGTGEKRKSEVFDLLKRSAGSGCFDNREDWIECGMAMKASGYSFEEWMELSWDTEREAMSENQNRWNGFNADRHSMGTLVRFARMADPGFMIKRTAGSPSEAVTAAGKTVNFLAMPWMSWYQPHVDVLRKKNQETGEYFDIHIPKATLENFEAMISFYKIRILENLMTRDIEIEIPGVAKTEGKSENAFHGMLLSLCVLNRFAVGNIDPFIVTIAHKNSYHPVRDWLNVLPEWDGRDRVQTILDSVLDIEYFTGVEKLPRTLLTKWLVSCVAAVMSKSYRGRGVLTFQGAQEIGKTSFFRSIVPTEHFDNWFKDGMHLDTKDKDSVKRVISYWIVELGEIEGMFKKEISALKAFITSDEDILRLPYERKSERYPRRTILCATVNDPNFLNDPTGSSRFWVLTAKSIQYNHNIDISQLWAQALFHYRAGMPWWLEGLERDWLTVSNANFYELDTHAELIKIKYDLETLKMNETRTRTMLATEIVIELGLKIEPKETKAVARALRGLGVREGWCANRSKGFVMPPLRLAYSFEGNGQNWGYRE